MVSIGIELVLNKNRDIFFCKAGQAKHLQSPNPLAGTTSVIPTKILIWSRLTSRVLVRMAAIGIIRALNKMANFRGFSQKQGAKTTPIKKSFGTHLVQLSNYHLELVPSDFQHFYGNGVNQHRTGT